MASDISYLKTCPWLVMLGGQLSQTCWNMSMRHISDVSDILWCWVGDLRGARVSFAKPWEALGSIWRSLGVIVGHLDVYIWILIHF
jgi:hypothetical protein